MLEYGQTGTQPQFNGELKVLFTCIKPSIDESTQKYIDKCEKLRNNAMQKQSIATNCNQLQANAGNKIKSNKNKLNNNILFNDFWKAYPKKQSKQPTT